MATNFANYDYELESQRLQKRRQLAEAMQLQAMQPGNPSGGDGTPYGAIAKVLQAYAGIKGMQTAQEDERALAERNKTDLQEGVQRYMKLMEGTPDAQGSVPDITGENADGTFQTGAKPLTVPGQKPDQKAALLDALSSNHPVLRNLAMQGLAQYGKREAPMSAKDILSLSDFDPKARIAAAMSGGDLSKLAPKLQQQVVGDRIVTNAGDGNYQVAFDGRPQYDPVGAVAQGPQGPIFGQREQGTGKVSFAPSGGTTVNVSTEKKAADAFGAGLAEARVKNLQTSYDNAIVARKALDSLGQAETQLQAGIKSGATANVALAIAKWGQALGIGDGDPSIANTETFRASMAQQVLASVKQLGSGTGISNADRDYAEKAAGGAITLDDKAMQRLMDIQKTAAANTLVGHQILLQKNSGASGAIPADLETLRVPFEISDPDGKLQWNKNTGQFTLRNSATYTPANGKGQSPKSSIPQAKPAAGKVLSLDEYLKQKGY